MGFSSSVWKLMLRWRLLRYCTKVWQLKKRREALGQVLGKFDEVLMLIFYDFISLLNRGWIVRGHGKLVESAISCR
jgi:hypothetical protein